MCPFPETKVILKPTDESGDLYDFFNTACLDICAELAGFGTFDALVAVGAVSGSLSLNALGLSSNTFGGSLGVPAALLPGIA